MCELQSCDLFAVVDRLRAFGGVGLGVRPDRLRVAVVVTVREVVSKRVTPQL